MGMNPFLKFIKKHIADSKAVSTGSVLLNDAFSLPLEGSLLIRSHPYSGATSVLLELVQELTSRETLVVYWDVAGSLFEHRLGGIDSSFLILGTNAYPNDILGLASRIVDKYTGPVAFIIDNAGLIREDRYDLRNNLDFLVKQFNKIAPEATVICSQRRGKEGYAFDYIIEVEQEKNIYDTTTATNKLVGHIARVRGPLGTATVYVSHFTGRLSKAYEHATLEIRAERATSLSAFELDGVKAQGIHNFIREHEEWLIQH